MPGSGTPTEPSSYSPGGVMVIPPTASVIPKPLQSSTPWRWKKRKTAGSRWPAAERPQRRRSPTTARTAASPSSGRASARSRSCAQRRGMPMSPVGRTRGRARARVSSDGFPANTYVPPQNSIPSISK